MVFLQLLARCNQYFAVAFSDLVYYSSHDILVKQNVTMYNIDSPDGLLLSRLVSQYKLNLIFCCILLLTNLLE